MASLLSTKLYIPTLRREIISRLRLINSLNSGLHSKLILVSAPAGFGKTTLLTDWLNSCKLPACWLSVDNQDDNFERFFYYVITSLQSINIRVDKQIFTILESCTVEKKEELLNSIINHISTYQERFVLVIDDYHSIHSQEIHKALTFLLDHQPDNMLLVIVSRSDPPLRLARFRAKGELCEIRTEDLRFTENESFLFFNQCMGVDLGDSDIATLTQKTEGWIAGLQLAAISLQNNIDKHTFITSFAGDDRYIADYLLDEVLHHQPEHIQKFLLKTSILNKFNASLCNEITEREDSHLILAELEMANLFIFPMDNRREWYRYHHLFSSLLLHRQNRNNKDGIRLLHLKASKWHEGQGFIDEAIRHAIQANDPERLASLSERHIFCLDNQSNLIEFVHWLDSQTNEVLCQHPWLLLAKVEILINASHYQLLEPLLNQAESCFDKNDQRATPVIAAFRALQAEFFGDIASMEKYTNQAIDNLPEKEPVQHSLVYLLLGAVQYWSGDISSSEASLRRAYRKGLEAGELNYAIIALSKVGMSEFMRGAVSQGVETMNEALRLSEENHHPTSQLALSIGYANILLGGMFLELGEIDKAFSKIQEGLRMCELIGNVDAVATGYSYLSRCFLSAGDYNAALAAIQKELALASKDVSDSTSPGIIESIEADLNYVHLKKGDMHMVSAWADRLNLDEDNDIAFSNRSVYSVFARFLISNQMYEAAIKVLTRLIDITRTANHQIALMKMLVLRALAFYLNQKEVTAIQDVQSAIEIAKPEGLVQTFLDEGEPLAELLYKAALQGIYPEFISQLLERFPVPPVPEGRIQVNLVDPLTNRELEVLMYIAKGHTNQEIARKLVLSLYTVKSHARNIFGKLGVKSRTEAVARARLLGLLPHD